MCTKMGKLLVSLREIYQFLIHDTVYVFSLSALTILARQQKKHQACENDDANKHPNVI